MCTFSLILKASDRFEVLQMLHAYFHHLRLECTKIMSEFTFTELLRQTGTTLFITLVSSELLCEEPVLSLGTVSFPSPLHTQITLFTLLDVYDA